ncbi:MAG: hypothetical protein ACRDG3_11565 [Tepidiformaceae bacterium]
MERRLPREYAGWQTHEAAFRRMTTPELVTEVQDGPPERRLAALSVIDLSEVDHETVEHWIRALPDAEANELAGAIPVQRPHASCKEDLRWVDVARIGYERRKLATFLVMLFSSLEALEARGCPEAAGAWEVISDWVGGMYDRLVESRDNEAQDDVSLFVFENYMDRAPVFEAFCAILTRQETLAQRVSANPSWLLSELSEAQQREALRNAEEGGGLPFADSWALLRDR